MSKMKALVLDAHSRAALETLQSLGRGGIEVDVAAENNDYLAMHSRYAVQKLQQPSQTDSQQFLTWLRAQDKRSDYTLIVPATEASLLGLRQLDQSDPLRLKAVVPDDDALDIALDKEKTWQLARELGVSVPEGVLLLSHADLVQADQFPLVLKPVRSKIRIGSDLRTLAVAVVKNEAERQQQLKRWLPLTAVQQQQYVFGRGVGIEFLFDRGEKIWHFAHERVHEYPLSGGASSYRRSIVPPADMLRDAEKLLTALKWHGVAMVEFKMNSNGKYWLMEINPRLWGSLALSIDAGVDFPIGLLQVASGQQPSAQTEYAAPYYTRDLRTDVEWMKSNLRSDPHDPLLHTRSRSFAFAELLRPLLGRESWDHFDWRDLGVTRRNLAAIVNAQLRPIYVRIRNWRTRTRLYRHHHSLLQRLSTAGGPDKIVFLCYGNICRSPLAARLAQQRLAGIAIESAGFHETTGRRSPERMLRISASYGIDLSDHRSERVNRSELAKADLIIVMDLQNRDQLQREFAEMRHKATLLGLFSRPQRVTIADPYLADDATAMNICAQVISGVDGLVQWVNTGEAAKCTAALPSAAGSH